MGCNKGLSNGQLTIVWLAYILSEGDHRKSGGEARLRRAQSLGQTLFQHGATT